MDLKDFIKIKLKEREKTLEDLAVGLDISRSKLSRVLIPNSIMPLSIMERLITYLNLNEEDQKTLKNIAGQSASNENIEISSWRNFIENPDINEFYDMSNNFVYYDSEVKEDKLESIIRDLEDLLKTTKASIEQKDNLSFNKNILSIRMCECFYGNLLSKLFEWCKTYNGKWEHLYTWGNYEREDRIEKFSTMVSFSSYENYVPYYNGENDTADSDNNIHCALSNTFLIRIGNCYYQGEIRFDKLHILKSNEAMATFYRRKFDSAKITVYDKFIEQREVYTYPASPEDLKESDLYNAITNLIHFNDLFIKIESRHSHLLIKPNMCYDSIPPYIFSQICNNSIIQAWRDKFPSIERPIDKLLERLKLRYELKYSRNGFERIEFYSNQGIKAFLDNKHLSDPLPFLNNFTSEQCNEILADLDANNSKENLFRYYKSNKKYFDNKYTFICLKGYGFIIDYHSGGSDYNWPPASYCIIRLPCFSEEVWNNLTSDEFINSMMID